MITTMNWTEIKIKIPVKDIETAAAIAQMTVPYGIYIEDYSHLESEVEEIAHIDLIDEDLLKSDRSHAIIHIYISPEENPAEAVAYLKEQLALSGILFVLRFLFRRLLRYASLLRSFLVYFLQTYHAVLFQNRFCFR